VKKKNDTPRTLDELTFAWEIASTRERVIQLSVTFLVVGLVCGGTALAAAGLALVTL
jgi:hypothetical protein